jgi:hypothetical protein
VTATDPIGSKERGLADGSIVEHRRVLIRTLEIGGRTPRDVEGIVDGFKSTLLLGQTGLRQLEPWRLDTGRGHLPIMDREADGPDSAGRSGGEREPVGGATAASVSETADVAPDGAKGGADRSAGLAKNQAEPEDGVSRLLHSPWLWAVKMAGPPCAAGTANRSEGP